MAWIKAEILLPNDLDAEDAELVGEELLEYITNRTKDGLGKDGKPFPGYSKEYMESLNFKIAGKSKGKVDLTLSGEMLDSLQVLKASKGKVTIGFEKGDKDINGRAEGNILGSYGGSPNKKKARNFMDLSDMEIASVLGRLSLLDKNTQKEISKVAKSTAVDFLNMSTYDVGEDDE